MSDEREWRVSRAYPNCVTSKGGISRADCPTPEIAAQIVREHNAHEGLVEALEKLLYLLTTATTGPYYARHEEIVVAVQAAQAALAKAEGKP